MKKSTKELMENRIAVFITLFIVEAICVYNVQFCKPIADVVDEFSMLMIPAKLAGYDWSMVSDRAMYYGFGYYCVFAPLFKMGIGIEIIYKTIIITTCILEGLIIPIVFDIVDRLFHYKNIFVISMIAMGFFFASVAPICKVLNEPLVILSEWIMVWLLIRIVRDNNKMCKNIFVCVLAYSLTIHTRSVVNYIVIVILALFVFFFFKKKIFEWQQWLMMGLSYVAVKLLILKVQLFIWNTNDLTNSKISLYFGGNYSVVERIKGFLLCLIGNITAVIIWSFSVGVIAIAFSIIYVIKALRRNVAITNDSLAIISVIVFSVVAASGGLFLLCFNSSIGVYEVYRTNVLNYSSKSIVYLRYYLAYLLPCIFVGLMLFLVGCKSKIVTRFNLLFCTFMLVIWDEYVVRLIANMKYGVSSLYPFSWLLNDKSRVLDVQKHEIIVLFVFLILIVITLLLMKNCKKMIIAIFSVTMVLETGFFVKNINSVTQIHNYRRIDKSLEYVLTRGDGTVVYVDDEEELNYMIMQLYLYNYKIVKGLPSIGDADGIVVTRNNVEDLVENLGYHMVANDDKEFVYSKFDK